MSESSYHNYIQKSWHPCPYCKASYDSKNGIWSKSRGERTFEDNLLNCSKWMDKAGCKLDKSKDYYNCVHPPMITGTRIIEKCPPAPLHVCKLGPFNHIIKNLAKISPDAVEKFVDEIKVSREKYHGGEYEGNKISKCFIYLRPNIRADIIQKNFI